MSDASRVAKYSYRAYPTPSQRRWLAGAFGAARVVYNDYIWQKERVHCGDQPELLPLDSRKNIPADKIWLLEYPTAVIQQARRQAETAYRNFLEV
jgi:putative transposase